MRWLDYSKAESTNKVQRQKVNNMDGPDINIQTQLVPEIRVLATSGGSPIKR